MKEYKCLDCGQINSNHNMLFSGNRKTGHKIQCPDCFSYKVTDWAMIPETNKHYVVFERPKGSTVFTMSKREGLQTIYHKHETAKRDVDSLIRTIHETEFAIYVCRIATIHSHNIVSLS